MIGYVYEIIYFTNLKKKWCVIIIMESLNVEYNHI